MSVRVDVDAVAPSGKEQDGVVAPVEFGAYHPLGADPVEFEVPRGVEAEAEVQCGTNERAAILWRAEEFICGYVVLPRSARLPVALWTVATHAADRFDAFPYLCFSSPLPRCGKTRAVEILELLVYRPWRGITPSEAALFRFLATSPTLLLDEVETLSSKNRSERDQAILSILNAGYRQGATVIRCNGQAHELEKFNVYGPKALCVVGNLSPTLADRSIVISMQRRRADEPLRRFRFARSGAEGKPIREEIVRQVKACAEELASVYAELPDLEFLTDRDSELWGPLFAVCSVFAPARLAELEASARNLSGAKAGEGEDDSLPLRLLSDVRRLWPDGTEHWPTVDMRAALKSDAESPWASDFELNPRRLARMLRPFGILSRDLRTNSGTKKGYTLDSVQAAFSRYITLESATSATSRINTGRS